MRQAASAAPPIAACPWPRLLLVLALLAAGLRSIIYRKGPTPFQHCHSHTPILIGTHHKTGTVLLKHIFLHEVCPLLKWRCSFDNSPVPCASPEQAQAAGLHVCFLQHGVRFKLQETNLPYRFIHAIRDPLEVVLSGYQYHLKTTEKWANRVQQRYNGTTYRKYLNALSLDEGLRAEVTHSMRDSLKTMPRLLNRTRANSCTLTVRLEDFEADWSGTVARLWDLLGVDAAVALTLDRAVAKHNVYTDKRKYNRHVSNLTTRSPMRQQFRILVALLPDAYAKIVAVRRRLGYPDVGKEADGS